MPKILYRLNLLKNYYQHDNNKIIYLDLLQMHSRIEHNNHKLLLVASSTKQLMMQTRGTWQTTPLNGVKDDIKKFKKKFPNEISFHI